MKKIRAILIGAGQRGAEAYAPYALTHPDEIEFVAVAEPDDFRREKFARMHTIPPERQFRSWEALLQQPQLGEAAIITTQDWLHAKPAVAAMRGGYHILLEKPMATTPEECRLLVEVSQQTDRQMHVCHVLRYTRHIRLLKEIVQSGQIGEVIDVDHRENVSFWHMAHSYVRGNWRNSKDASPMILAKCCHDLDMLPWVLEDYPVTLSSTGSLKHFRIENAPAGSPERCLDGCPIESECPYSAWHIYIDMAPFWHSYSQTCTKISERWITQQYIHHPNLIRWAARIFPVLRRVTEYQGWPLTVLTSDPNRESILHALREGPYGRCVYRCDNDVVDHQVVNMEFNSGTTVTLTMHGHSHIEHRSTRIEASRGRIQALLGNGGGWIQLENHRSRSKKVYDTSPPTGEGHGGGDTQLMADFVRSVQQDGNSPHVLKTAQEALASHLLGFAAETARLEHCTQRVGQFWTPRKTS